MDNIRPAVSYQPRRGVPYGFRAAQEDKSFIPDPITAKEQNLHPVPTDRLLEYSTLDRFAHHLKTVFVTLPQTVMKGLRGDSDFGFSDFMLISKVPYYLGGTCLVSSFLMGRGKGTALRQGIGVFLYYAGVSLSNHFINGLYRLRYGVDLGQLYRRADGRVEKVFASSDFPRFDLLTPQQYRHMREKMEIPSNVADPDKACRDQISRVISSSRAMKLFLGNIVAAVGAGYLAQSDGWLKLFKGRGVASNILKEPQWDGWRQRFKNFLVAKGALIEEVLKEKGKGLPGEASPGFRRFTLFAFSASLGLCIFESLNVLKPERYQSSPAPLIPWGDRGARRDSLFNYFQQLKLEVREHS
jgi:hypothetical protein